MVAGAGQSQVATQLIDLALNALVGMVLIALLRRFLMRTPAIVEAARAGDAGLTPQLIAAVGGGSEPHLLPRPDPTALTSKLTSAERVIALLASGLAAEAGGA